MKSKSLGDRMKEYEVCSKSVLTKRIPTIIRIDGKAFHSYTKGFVKPWDERIMRAFTDSGIALMKAIQGCKFTYIQSDEISLLLTDYESLDTEAWFGKSLQKMVSVSSSICTAAFNKSMNKNDIDRTALFDSRAFTVPKEDVCNYFLWRQQDAIRNSVQGLAQSTFSHKELHGLNCEQLKEKLLSVDVSWENLPNKKKHGWGIVKKQQKRNLLVMSNPPSPAAQHVVRTKVCEDSYIPNFGEDRDFIEKFL